MTQNQLKQLIGDYHEDAFMWSKQCVAGDSDNAGEVLQMVYLKILEGKAKYNGRSTIKTWLFAIIRYTAIDLIKSRHNNVDIALVEITDTNADNNDTYHHLLNLLPEKQRQVLLLAFYHNMTLKEVAKTLELGIGTVGQHYCRGKKKLKKLIVQQREEFTKKSKIYG